MEKKKSTNEIILSLIPTKSKDAVSSSALMELTGLTFRQLKKVIAELRIVHPICSKETEGGGYWLGDDEDVQEFVKMITRRRDGYNKTIEIMTGHLFDGGLE